MIGRLKGLAKRIREAGLRKAPVVIAETLRRAIAPRLVNIQVVYRLDPELFAATGAGARRADLVYRSFDSLEDVPETLWSGIEADEAAELKNHFAGRFAGGAKVWVALVDGELAGFQWTVRGALRPNWFVELAPEDVVLFAVSTRNAFRGRGVHSALMRHLMENELRAGGAIYCDVSKWNKVARRNSEAIGFRAVLERPPLADFGEV